MKADTVTDTGLSVQIEEVLVDLPEQSRPISGIALTVEGCGFNLSPDDAARIGEMLLAFSKQLR